MKKLKTLVILLVVSQSVIRGKTQMNVELNNLTPVPEVHFRCPHCQKLYKTLHDVFDGAQPEFDCVSCEKTFTLTQNQNSFGLFDTHSKGAIGFTECPKCTHLKPHNQDECPSCGVYASRYEALQKVESPELFELNQMWQKVVESFDQDELHQDFLNKCQKKMALSFAFKKYSDLQKTVSFDSLCERYMKQIELRLDEQFKSPQNKSEVKTKFVISQWLYIAVGCVGLSLLIYNKIKPTFPNLTGLVVAITVLSFGLGVFSSQQKDFKL